MFKSRFIFIALLFAFHISSAQRNNIWYFGGNAGVSFAQSPPVALHNSAMETDEGSASVCDKNGNLVFYTNGVTVYNRIHEVMLNGNGLLGSTSTVQSAVVIPQPGSNDIYYIFTADAIENDFINGYNYSIVDMTKDNGKGEVVSKNILLSSSCTERLTAARHADGTSVWVITNDRNSNHFNAWLIGCSGLSGAPVVSVAGNVLDTYDLMNTGMMKVSPDGKQLCQTHYPFFSNPPGPNYFQLFDFNNATGELTNARAITLPNSRITGCEYSSNSKLLYLTRPHDKALDQVEATLPLVTDIVASRITISTNAEYYGIQLAPDQKIYLAKPSQFLAAINNPNTKGAGCNYQEKQLNLSGGSVGAAAFLGLPSFINDASFDGSNGFTYTILDSCSGNVQFNGFTSITSGITWDWDFGDGFTAASQNPIHTFSSAKSAYTVSLKIQSTTGCGSIERSIKVIPKGIGVDPAFEYLTYCGDGKTQFTNLSTFFPDTATIKYLWDFGDGNTSTVAEAIHSFAVPGTYDVKLTIQTSTACLDRSLTRTLSLDALNITAHASPLEIDPGDVVYLSAVGGGTRFEWTHPATLSDPKVANPIAKPVENTTYIVTAYNDAGCKDTASVTIKVRMVPGVYVPSGFTPNNDGKNDVFKPILTDEFTLLEFSIYNRWGQKIFTTSKKEVGWNGKIDGVQQDSGVYICIIKAVDTRTGAKKEIKGTFVILR